MYTVMKKYMEVIKFEGYLNKVQNVNIGVNKYIYKIYYRINFIALNEEIQRIFWVILCFNEFTFFLVTCNKKLHETFQGPVG